MDLSGRRATSLTDDATPQIFGGGGGEGGSVVQLEGRDLHTLRLCREMCHSLRDLNVRSGGGVDADVG